MVDRIYFFLNISNTFFNTYFQFYLQTLPLIGLQPDIPMLTLK